MPFDVSGLRAYAAHLQQAPDRLRDQTASVLAASGARLEAAMKQRAAVDTGMMRNTISMDVGDLEVSVGPTVPYAIYVEYGTSRMAPQPFVGPALDVVEPQFLKAMEAVAAKALD